MAAMVHEPFTHEDVLLEGFLALNVPEGFRAELIEGEIIVTPPPDGDHEKCISRVVRQVTRQSLVDMDVSGNKGLLLGTGAASAKDHVIPDATFGPLDLFRGADSWMPGDGVAMVLEVTPFKRRHDPELELRAYARSGIPLYLLIDRDDASVTLFSEPGKEDYRQHTTVPFGKSVPLPHPFGFDLETAEFL